MTRSFLLAAAVLGAATLAAPASAQSYMQQCDRLISDWKACSSGGGSCEAQYSAIEEECRCHTFRRDEWVLVNAAVAQDNVCGRPPNPPTINDPGPPPPDRPGLLEPRGDAARPEERGG